MTSELLSEPAAVAATAGPEPLTDERLAREVADVMTPGCVVISDAATAADAARAIAAHGVDAVLVVDARVGTPLGWVTARGVAAWLGPDNVVGSARDAIAEAPRGIAPHASARAAQYALALAGTTRLLVRHKTDALPQGVLTKLDLAMAAGR